MTDGVREVGVQENLRTIGRLFSAWSAHDWDRLEALHAPSAIHYGPDHDRPVKTPGAIVEAHRRALGWLPDLRLEVDRAFGQGNLVCAEVTTCGTHRGPMPTPDGTVAPATGRSLRLPGCFVFRVEGGRVTDYVEYRDTLSVWTGLGFGLDLERRTEQLDGTETLP